MPCGEVRQEREALERVGRADPRRSSLHLAQQNKLAIVVMILFSFFWSACGLTFEVIPFISRRFASRYESSSNSVTNSSSNYVADRWVWSGGRRAAGEMLGGGGDAAALLQGDQIQQGGGITYTGMMILCCTIPIMFIYFPMWGGMLRGPSAEDEATEEKYYSAEWSAEEKARGLHLNTVKFADNCRGERGRRPSIAVPY